MPVGAAELTLFVVMYLEICIAGTRSDHRGASREALARITKAIYDAGGTWELLDITSWFGHLGPQLVAPDAIDKEGRA